MPIQRAKVVEPVYIGRENVARVKFEEYDPATELTTPISWTNVTRMVLNLVPEDGGAEIVADTNVDSSYMDFTVDGYVGFKLGDVPSLAAGRYYGRLTAFDAGGNDTELTHEGGEARMVFVVLSTSTIS